MHVCEGFFITSFMNAVQFVHSSDREEPVASLGAHRQRPATTRQSEDDFTSAQPPESLSLSVTPVGGPKDQLAIGFFY